LLKQKTVYFREEDLPLWEQVSNKAEWLHQHLEADIKNPHFIKAKNEKELADLTFGKDCPHANVNKRNGICLDCGEYIR
jgi:hypothetical protein